MPSRQQIISLAQTMDTEYPNPIPYIRPELTMESTHDVLQLCRYSHDAIASDPRYSTPLPNRKTRDKSILLSRFEQLPYEIRELIYLHLGFPYRGKIWIKPCKDKGCKISHHHPTAEEWKKYPDGNFLIPTTINEEYVTSYSIPWIFSDQGETWDDSRVNGGVVNSGVWILNKAITEDIMSVTNICQLVTCIFDYRLSEKRAYWNCSRYRRDQSKRENRKSWSRMATSPMMFSFLSHISIDHVGMYHDEFQSGPAVMRRRRDLKILKHVETIRFITKHCPRIKTFGFNHNTMDLVRFESSSESDSESGFVEVASNKGKEALVFAFRELVQKRPGLITLKRFISQGREIYRGTEYFVTSFLNFYATIELDLSLMPEYERQDRTERWVREGMEAHRESQYISIGDIYW